MSANTEKFVQENDFLVSKTDTKGIITYCNQAFMKIVGAKEKDLLGKNHNIVRHPDMPKIVFKLLWDTVKSKKEIFAYVKNRSFDGGFYWVFANATPSLDIDGNIIGYHSVRRKPNPKAISIIAPLYAKMLEAEKSGGMQASKALLEQTLSELGTTYDELINNLQRKK